MRPRLTTLKDLKAKYGPNWGLDSVDPKKKPPVPAPTIAELEEHYRKFDLGFVPKRQE